MGINHGLARTTDCLPANMAINLRFHRANAECCFMKYEDTCEATKLSDKTKKKLPVTFDESVITIKNPLLHAYYAYSHELETVMSRVKTAQMEIPFMGKKKNRS